MLRFIETYLEKRRVRKSFEKYVSPGAIRRIQQKTPWFPKEPEPKHFQFVVVQIDDDQLDDINRLLGIVVDTSMRHGGVISHISPSLVMSYLGGVPFPKFDSPETRMALVNELMTTAQHKVRIAHGECVGLIGAFGSSHRFYFGAIIPNFSTILRKLLDAAPGAVIEVL